MKQIILALLTSLALFFALFFGLKWNVFVVIILSLGTYLGVFMVTKPRLKIGNIRIDKLEDGDELKALLLDAKEDMDHIKKASAEITNLALKEESQRLYNTGVKILEYLEEHPERISTARRFFTYYLDTARDILEKYLPFQRSGLRTEDVENVFRSTQKALPILNEAFERQFNHLMQNDIIDIESDIKVLEMNLKMDGE
jgi:5-bromo-4-chloroindolyl phosphate hydrolysis protein